MGDIVTQSADRVFSVGEYRNAKFAWADVAAAQTDASVIAAVTGKRILVLAVAFLTGSTATTLVFNTKGAGAGTQISCTFANDINGGAALPYSPVGWFKTNIDEALTVTTGAGATTGIQVAYIETL